MHTIPGWISYTLFEVNSTYIYSDWTRSFKKAVGKLKNFNNAKKRCQMETFLERPGWKGCDGVKGWMNLFDLFGTHITFSMSLGIII